MIPDQRIILKDGRQLAYAEYGSPAGIPLIAFHGMPGSRLGMKVFDEIASTIGVRVIAPDRPGFGLSLPHPGGTLTSYPDDIRALCDHLGIERFAVVGASGGAPYSLACAYRLQDRVAAAGVVSGIGPLARPGSLQTMMPVNRIVFALGRVSPGLVGLVLPRLIRSSMPGMEKHVEQGTSPSEAIDPATFAMVVADQRESVRSGGAGIAFDLKNLWRDWKIPFRQIVTRVLLWHGESDNLAPTALAHYLAGELPNCEAIFYPGEDHAGPLMKHKAEILNAIKAAYA